MARRVVHYFEGTYDYGVSEQKTLCNRVITRLYRYRADIGQVTCSRCIAKLAKQGRMAGQPNGSVLTVNNVSDVNCDDEHHEAWLSRLGCQSY